MTFRNVLLALLVSLLTVGCSGNPKRNSLPRVEPTTIELTRTISAVQYRGLNYRVEIGLVPGAYTSERKDESGVYFFGEGRSYWEKNEGMWNGRPELRVGGLYVPTNPAEPPKFFSVSDGQSIYAEDLDTYIQSRLAQPIGSTVPAATKAGAGTVSFGTAAGALIVGAFIDASVGTLYVHWSIKDEDRELILAALKKAKNTKTSSSQ